MAKYDITMSSEVFEVTKILKKTKAMFFEDIKVGDKLQFSADIEYVGTSRGRSYAVCIQILNLTQIEKAYKTFNELPKFLDYFELCELQSPLITKLEERIDELEDELSDAENERDEFENDLDRASDRIDELTDEVSELHDKIESLDEEISDLNDVIQDFESDN